MSVVPASTVVSRERITSCCKLLAILYVSYLLLTSAIAHLQNPYHFLAAVLDYQILSNRLAVFASGILPFLHICIATSLLLMPRVEKTFLTAGVLFTAYTLGQFAALFEGRNISCGCFGFEETASEIGWSSLLLSSSIVASCIVGALASRHVSSSNPAAHLR